MKNLIFTLIGCLMSGGLLAGNGQYEAAMGKNIPAMFAASSTEELTKIVNQFERIGDAEGDKWEPYYYASFGYIRLMQFTEDAATKDQYLDKAMNMIEKGEQVNPNESELESLRGYVHMMRLTVDPATRGQQYSGLAFNSFNKAVSLNPDNPRAVFLLGQMQLGTAQFFGGGDGGSCETFRKASTLFENDNDENPFAPSWGKSAVEEALKGCEN